jgi:hypothetical protein
VKREKMNEEVFDLSISFDADLFRAIFREQKFDLAGFENYLNEVLCLKKHITNFYESNPAGFRIYYLTSSHVPTVCQAIALEVLRSEEMKDFARVFMSLRPPILGSIHFSPQRWVKKGRYDLFQNLVDFWEKEDWLLCLRDVDEAIARHGTTDILDILLANGYEPPLTMVYIAVVKNEFGVLQRLFDYGLDASPTMHHVIADEYSTLTPLQAAIDGKKPSMIHTLFLHGASIDHDSRYLQKAIQTQDVATLEALLCYIHNVNECKTPTMHCLFLAIEKRSPVVFLQMLVKSGADVNYAAKQYWGKDRTPLSYAIETGNVEAEEYLRSVGAK